MMKCIYCRNNLPEDGRVRDANVFTCTECGREFGSGEVLRLATDEALARPSDAITFLFDAGGVTLRYARPSRYLRPLMLTLGIYESAWVCGLFYYLIRHGNTFNGELLILLSLLLPVPILIVLVFRALMGRTEIRSSGDRQEIFSGIGTWGRRIGIAPERVVSVERRESALLPPCIVVRYADGRTDSFGRFVEPQELQYLCEYLRHGLGLH